MSPREDDQVRRVEMFPLPHDGGWRDIFREVEPEPGVYTAEVRMRDGGWMTFPVLTHDYAGEALIDPGDGRGLIRAVDLAHEEAGPQW